jgi:hypothetical protein
MKLTHLSIVAAASALTLASCSDGSEQRSQMAQPSSTAAASGSVAQNATTSRAAAAAGTMTANLSAAQEVPPVNSQGRGDAQMMLDPSSKQLRWTVNYTGLSGPATAAHIHTGASGANGPVAINLSPGSPPQNPITGTATLTDAQMQQLMSGQAYVNVHTQANPGGEVRGQVMMPR